MPKCRASMAGPTGGPNGETSNNKVFVLVPTTECTFLAQWNRLYEVLAKVREVGSDSRNLVACPKRTM